MDEGSDPVPCSFGIASHADRYLADPTGEEEAEARKWARANKLPVTLWTGTDELAADAGIRGLVIGPASVEANPVRLMFDEPKKGPSVDDLVQAAGLRGVRVRGARIDPENGNLVRNEDGATTKDVLLLMDSVKRAVARTSGIQLVERLAVIGRRRPRR